jgi:TRAP-type C4-dicarboxylate transport system permease small subunit
MTQQASAGLAGSRIEQIDRLLRRATVVLAFCGLLALFLNAIAVVADVLLRAAFSAPIDRLSDVSAVIIYCAAACCLPAATASRRHITIGALDGILSWRALEVLKAFAALVCTAVFGLIAWQVALYAQEMQHTGERLSQIDISVAPFWAFVALCLVLNAAVQGFNVVRHGWRAVSGAAAPDTWASAEGSIV